jgi:hypothetical protein
MKFSRRDLFKTAAAATGGVAAGTVFDRPVAGSQSAGQSLPPAFDALKPLGDRVKPIPTDELQARVARAQQLMTRNHAGLLHRHPLVAQRAHPDVSGAPERRSAFGRPGF